MPGLRTEWFNFSPLRALDFWCTSKLLGECTKMSGAGSNRVRNEHSSRAIDNTLPSSRPVEAKNMLGGPEKLKAK